MNNNKLKDQASHTAHGDKIKRKKNSKYTVLLFSYIWILFIYLICSIDFYSVLVVVVVVVVFNTPATSDDAACSVLPFDDLINTKKNSLKYFEIK